MIARLGRSRAACKTKVASGCWYSGGRRSDGSDEEFCASVAMLRRRVQVRQSSLSVLCLFSEGFLEVLGGFGWSSGGPVSFGPSLKRIGVKTNKSLLWKETVLENREINKTRNIIDIIIVIVTCSHIYVQYLCVKKVHVCKQKKM